MKQQKGSGKKRRALPLWLSRFRLDRRIQMVCLFAAAMAGILFVLNRYHTRYIRSLDYDSTAVVSREMFDSLKQGTAETGDVIWLPAFSASEPVYRRGSHYYIGEDYVRIEDGAPLFVNQGTYANPVSGEGNLINAQWEEEAVIAGMYLSNGQSFNFDGTMIEDEEIFFLRMSNGLYLNTKELYLEGAQQKFSISTNSFMHIGEEGIRYYVRQDGEKMIYGVFSQIYGASVEIGGQVMTYGEFLEKLGIVKNEPLEEEKDMPETQTQTEPELSLESATDSSTEVPEESLLSRPEDESPQPERQAEGSSSARENEDGDSQEGRRKDSQDKGRDKDSDTSRKKRKPSDDDWGNRGDSGNDWNQGGNSGGSSGTSGSESGSGSETSSSASTQPTTESGTSQETETSVEPGTGSSGEETTAESTDTGTETPVKPGTGSDAERPATGSDANKPGGDTERPGTGSNAGRPGDGSGSGPGPVIPWSKPEVSISELETDIYSALGTMTVTDRAGVFSRVSLTMSWDTQAVGRPGADTPVQYRKTLKSGGDFQIDNLPPGTWIYVQAYLKYYDENGKRVQETEPFYRTLIRTEPFDRADHVYIQFSDDIRNSTEGRYYENQMSAYDLHLSSSNKYLLDKIYRGTVTVYGQDGSEMSFNLSNVALRKFKLAPQDYVSLLSQGSLPPNQEYRYRLDLFDRFGNSFLEAEKICWGETESQGSGEDYKATGHDRPGTLYKPEDGARWNSVPALGSQRFWAYTHTAKTIPAGEITVLPTSTQNQDSLSKIQMHIAITDIHSAMSVGAGTFGGSGAGGAIEGTPPGGGQNYKLYYGIYSNEKGTAVGNELKTTAVLRDGKIVIREDGAGSPYHYLDDRSLPGGDSDSLIYEVEDLTAGETYTIRVFGVYDLNDNFGAVEKELGSARFSTISLSSYGRVYYTFTTSHIKTPQPIGVESYNHEVYESATAQKITMAINTSRTNATLAKEYYNHFILNLRYRRDSNEFLQLQFNREQLENRIITVNDSQLDENGSYTYEMSGGQVQGTAGSYDYYYRVSSADVNGRLPKAAMRIPVKALPDSVKTAVPQGDGSTSYTFNLWDAFLAIESVTDAQTGRQVWAFAGDSARTAMELTFEDDTLQSFTSYMLVSESYAKQGIIEDHDITASSNAYRQCSFTTLKEMPFVTIGGILQVGRYLYLVDIKLHDTDKAIYDGRTMLNNVNLTANNATATLPEILDYGADGGGIIAKEQFGSLRSGSRYELRVVPVDIRRTGGTGQPRIQNVSLYEYEYVAGRGVSGSIFLSGVTYPLKELSEGGQYRTISDYNKYEVGNFDYGTMSGSKGGKLAIDDTTNGTLGVMEGISVSPGQIFYLHNLAGNTATSTASIAFLDVNENLAGPIKTIYGDSYIRIPEGTRYMRAQITGARNTGGRTNVANLSQAQAILVYDKEDPVLTEKLKMVSGQAPPFTKSGNAYTFTLDRQALVGNDAIALVSGEWAGSGNGSFGVRYVFKDGSGNTISEETGNVYSGYVKSIPSGAASAEVTVTVSLKDSDGGEAAPDVRAINTGRVKAFSQYLFDTLIASYQAEVYDYAGSLTDVSSGDVKLEVESIDSGGQSQGLVAGAGLTGKVSNYVTYEDGRRDGYYQGNNNFETANGYTYRLKLSIRWRGEYYILDEQEFTAQGNEYTIATGKQLLKLVTWPTGRFLVTDDLGVIDPRTLAYVNQTFYGHLNGQGHSLDMNITGGGSFIPTLGGAAILENLDITETLGTSDKAMNYVYPIGTNRGTIRNVVFHMNTGRGNYRHSDIAGICRMNEGTIENFALYFTYASDSAGNYMGSASGGVTSYNSGTIRNGVVYGARTLDATTGVWGGSEDISLGSIGGVAASNQSGGTIEQVMVIMNMRVERNASVLTQEAPFGSYGLIAGSNGGMVRNCFTNGEMTYGYWELNGNNVYQMRYTSGNNKIAWPGGNYSSAASVRNCYYFSGGQYKANNEYVSYQSGTMALRSPMFYGSTINREGAFVVESQLEGGYYPIVSMPECMEGTQSNIPLNAGLPGSLPVYISTSAMKEEGRDMLYLENDIIPAGTVEKLKSMVASNRSISWDAYFTTREDGSGLVKKQFAIASMAISNRMGYVLDNIRVKDLTTTVLAETTSSEICELTVLLTPYLGTTEDNLTLSSRPTSFTSSYEVESVDYGYSAGALNTLRLSDASFALDFYYPLSGETWGQIQGGTGLDKMNFRMVDDIAFDLKSNGGSFEESRDLTKALTFFNTTLNCGAMGGIFDGNNHTLDFCGRTINGYYFREIFSGAQVKNVIVDNLNLTAGTGNEEYAGFIRRAEAKATLSHIHMRNVTVKDIYRYGGAVAAYVSTATVENCTVAKAAITSKNNASDLYAGGMIGYRNGAGVTRNSFVRDLDMRIMDGSTVSGVGGLLGGQYSGSSVNYARIVSCYVQGHIQTAFANCGGLVGRGNGFISSVWTAADIVGTNNIGSLVGYAMASGLNNFNTYSSAVVSGELYSSTQDISRRLVGIWERDVTNCPWTYAYKGQLINSNARGEAMDVTELTDAQTMMSYYYWTDIVGIGSSFCLYGSGDIRDVSEAPVYPILYATDGKTLLPDQAEVSYEVVRPSFEVTEASAREKGDSLYGTYDIEIKVKIGGTVREDQLKTALTSDGLVFADATMKIEGTSQETDEEGNPITMTTVSITGADPVKRLDSYRLDYIYDSSGNKVSTKLEFKDDAGEPMYLYWKLDSAEKWRTKMGESGTQYENFMITGDIDLSNAAVYELKLNRLVGAKKPADYDNRSESWINQPEFYRLSNLMIPDNSYNMWISEIATYMGYLDIRGCRAGRALAMNKYGLIGSVVGNIEYIDLYKDTILVGEGTETYNYLGCIGHIGGEASNIRISDITIDALRGQYYYSYVGGFGGYVKTLENVCGRHVKIVMGNDSVNISRDYFGGIAGYVPSEAHKIYGEDMDITGRNSTGGLLGWLYQTTSDDALLERPDIEAVSVKVTGRSNVGGAVGYISGQSKNMRAMDGTVHAYTSSAGGVIGYSYYGTGHNQEAYGSTITADGNNAGGICGSGFSSLGRAKVAGCTVKAGESYAGGIEGGGYTSTYYNAVYQTTIEARSNAGGIIGRVVNSSNSGIGVDHDIYRNVVSATTITASGNYAGGIVGSVCGAEIYENEIMDTTTVSGQTSVGGVAGYTSGGRLHHNIVGCSVSANSNAGGVAGEMLGYGVSFSPGSTLKKENSVARAYSNLIACKDIYVLNNYVAGVAGLYIPGDIPVDGDGNPIPDTGYVDHMTHDEFYGNAVLAGQIHSRNVASRRQSWYANYEGDLQHYMTREPEPRYDCVLETLYSDESVRTNLRIPVMNPGSAVKETEIVRILPAALGTKDFYVKPYAEGGLNFTEERFDWTDLPAYYPYIGAVQNYVIPFVPYQKTGTIQAGGRSDWNTYYEKNGGTWVEKAFNGAGIPNPAAASTFNLKSVARGMVYPSGIDTINIDFGSVDTGFVTFEIPGLLKETSIDTLQNSAWTCSLKYDYETDFTLNLYSLDHSEKETYHYRAADLRSTIMSWNRKNYYLRSDGVYQVMEDGTGSRVLKGEFVNLYEGKALDADGQEYTLPDTGQKAEAEKEEE